MRVISLKKVTKIDLPQRQNICICALIEFFAKKQKVCFNHNLLSTQMVVANATTRPIWLSDGLVAHAKSQNKHKPSCHFRCVGKRREGGFCVCGRGR